MNKNNFIITLLLIVILAVSSITMFKVDDAGNNEGVALGSVMQGGEYNATTTISTSAGTHWVARSVTSGSSCTLGSIIVASSSATTFTIWNATSTTDVSSTTITTLKASVGEGTYTYDIVCSRGLVIETPASFDGSYTVTYR
jgi:hypothetical protein